jgi:hypothetical protein
VLVHRTGGGLAHNRAKNYIDDWDSNGDHKLSLGEFRVAHGTAAMSSAKFRSIDTSGDGKLGVAELARYLRVHGSV